MKKQKPSKNKTTHVNLIGMGLSFEAGRAYGVSWFSQGGFDFNEICYIPADETDPKRFFRKWLEGILMYITLPAIDIHIKPLEMK